MALLLQQVDATGNQAGVVERLFREPDVEFDAEFLEVVAAVFELFVERVLVHVVPVATEQFLGAGDQRVEMQFALLLGFVVGAAGFRQAGRAGEDGIGGTHVLVAVGTLQLRRHVAHVTALVGIRREGHDHVMLFEVAQPGRQAEDVHLPAGVIDVVLAGDVPAGEGQQARQRGAVGGAAAVADVQRAGRVGRDELDLHLLPAAGGGTAEVFLLGEHGLDHVGLAAGIEAEVDEAGTGDFGSGDQRRRR
ncbi:hypothetical protein SDC9_146067 [bioreactor metagenome]|uniref:Uncharacterized protein n=1 Tax=bioreactor metagenome TaxID=1076179 RepID=A0A645EAA5_9ZZZZ